MLDKMTSAGEVINMVYMKGILKEMVVQGFYSCAEIAAGVALLGLQS